MTNLGHRCSIEIALQMIEEGAAIRATCQCFDSGVGRSDRDSDRDSEVISHIYQRNKGINYFNYRKWRKTEDYAIQSENRDKIYQLPSRKHDEYIPFTRDEIKELWSNCTLEVIPPIGTQYKQTQRIAIKRDLVRLQKCLEENFFAQRFS